MNKTFRPCVIHVGYNQALSVALQSALKALGYRRFGSSDSYPFFAVEKTGCFSGDNGQWMPQYPRFDAATQFGALLEYLDKPEVKVNVIGCVSVEIDNREDHTGDILLTFPRRIASFQLLSSEIDALYAASQAARKEAE